MAANKKGKPGAADQPDTDQAPAAESWDELEKIFQTRIRRSMAQLGMPTAEDITALTRKVDELAARVERLAGGVKRQPQARKTARRASRVPRRS